ncbi:MAG: 50S ribosomal protein L4 [Phycisphaerales bacterium]|nr:50S ribosomal protein L4 [Phycisphaerales bacterium]
MDVPVFNILGAEVGTFSIDEQSLGGTINAALIKQAYVRYHTNQRQGSARTKNRHEVEGSTRKLYKQKGTGNARHGDRKANLFRGGGHGHSKKRTREDFRPDMPKKMRRKANRNALLAKLMDNEVRVIDSLSFEAPRTRAFIDFLGAINVDRSAIVAVAPENENIRLSARNADGVTLIGPEQLTCFELLNHRYLVISKSDLQAWLSGPASQTGKEAKTNPLGRAAAEEAA